MCACTAMVEYPPCESSSALDLFATDLASRLTGYGVSTCFSLYATMETSFDGVCFLCGRSVGGFDSSMRLNYNISTGDPCVFILCRAWVLKCLLHYILVRQHLNIISTTGSSKYHGYMALNVESDVKPPLFQHNMCSSGTNDQCFFIRPSKDRTYYGMALSVRPQFLVNGIS